MMWVSESTQPAEIWATALPADCNSGGPRSRTRQERLSATVLGRKSGTIRCPCSRILALDFKGADSLPTINALLAEAGIAGPEALRAVVRTPQTPAICRPNPAIAAIEVESADPGQVLETALLLGLCTQWVYDPSRPVLWTRTSLERRLELFDGEGFYA